MLVKTKSEKVKKQVVYMVNPLANHHLVGTQEIRIGRFSLSSHCLKMMKGSVQSTGYLTLLASPQKKKGPSLFSIC